jgi:23S rRNA (guanine745-N1)-methyltransferase
MRAEFLSYLRCPVCDEALATADRAIVGGAVRCPAGHTFDTARQGYLNLMAGPAPTDGDTTEMVAARAELLAAGHFDFLTDALTRAADELLTPYSPGLVLDVGAGTGHHLAAVLDRHPQAHGLALDVAKPAARRAARAHPRAAAVVCDIWRRLPIADGCADLVLDVFAPRNGAEFARVLRPGGALVVVTPRADHLRELVEALGLLAVDPDKERRVSVALEPWLRPIQDGEYAVRLALSHEDATRLVAMGPSARHLSAAELARRVAGLPQPMDVTAAVRVARYAGR